MSISGISTTFAVLSPSRGQVIHVLLTRPPLGQPVLLPSDPARLACLKHAASVRPEPGSNSPLISESFWLFDDSLPQATSFSHTVQFSRIDPPFVAVTVLYLISAAASCQGLFSGPQGKRQEAVYHVTARATTATFWQAIQAVRR